MNSPRGPARGFQETFLKEDKTDVLNITRAHLDNQRRVWVEIGIKT